jgi:predicted transposase YbfD/YdcC
MVLPECNTFVAYVRKVPDPRGKQGQQFRWWHLLVMVGWAMLCNQKVVRGIAEWTQEHAELLLEAFGEELPRIPSESTLRRALRYGGAEELEKHMAAFDEETVACRAAPCTAATGGWEGQSLDGKEARGANQHGAQVHLVSLVEQESGTVLAQQAVPAKSNEIKGAPELLRGRDLHGVVVTGDALLTQRALAQQILDQGGHYLMVVKRNQAELYEDIQTLFAERNWGPDDDRLSYTSHDHGHARYETRTLTSSEQLRGYLNWPGAQQVAQRICTRRRHPTDPPQSSITYAVTSLTRQQAMPEQFEYLWRGHWSIENRNHYVRDETLGEDRCQVFAGQAPRALAALRSGILALIRTRPWRCVPQALRHYNAHPRKALAAIGLPIS